MLLLALEHLKAIQAHGEQAYPEEGAGFLLGEPGEVRRVVSIQPLTNAREGAARHTRYLIKPEDYLKAEQEADRLKLTLLGVFHSHPDHPNLPSDYDREWAQPTFSYMITSVQKGKALASRSWRLLEDRTSFFEEPIQIESPLNQEGVSHGSLLRPSPAHPGNLPGEGSSNGPDAAFPPEPDERP